MFEDARMGLCDSCMVAIKPVITVELPITKTYSIPVFALSDYSEPLKKLVLAKSYSDSIASRVLGTFLWQKTPLSTIQFDCIVPIGLHWMRYAKRGYNQAYEMAVPISQASGKPIVELIKRVKKTEFQFLLPYEQRVDNLKEAFELASHHDSYEGKVLVVVDDVMTSGSTLIEAVKVLRKLKPKAIYAVVACRTLA